MPTPTGVTVLDEMLQGGLPENRAILLMGGPGTGKTTLGMQFLQEGLGRGEDCLFVSTEQTPEELADALAPYEFDLEHERLTIETIHATRGSTVESDSPELVLRPLDGAGTRVDSERAEGRSEYGFGHFSAPFTSDYIMDVLERHDTCDRVVFDSVSGLEAMSDDRHGFRQEVLDFARLFTDQFGATTLFTAEETTRSVGDDGSPAGMLRFNTHGVIRLWRERIEGDFHRFVQVRKMRGVDHETKAFEFEFDPLGVQVVPGQRTPSMSTVEYDLSSTGVAGLDELCGGGLIRGEPALLEHDGLASTEHLVVNTIVSAIDRGDAVVLLPPSNLRPARLESILSDRIGSVEELLENDRLFVVDLVGNWTEFDRNVFSIGRSNGLLRRFFGGVKPFTTRRMRRALETIGRRRGDRSALVLSYTDAMLQELTPADVRTVHQRMKEDVFHPEDTLLLVQNPKVMDGALSEFFVLDSQQVLRTWMHERGLQYVKLEKSPIGELGSSKLIKHVGSPPFVRIQRSDSSCRATLVENDDNGSAWHRNPVK